MPTVHSRYVVTETDDLAAALDSAANRWPHLARGQLLVQLVLEGHWAAEYAHDQRHRRRLTALHRGSGGLTSACPGDHIQAILASTQTAYANSRRP